MILKDNFYTIIASDVAGRSYQLKLMPDSVIYQAHFPGQPTTPGVCIVQIATELLSELLQANLELSAVVNAKFLAVINPTQNEEVQYSFPKLSVDESQGVVKVSVVVSRHEQVFTKLSLVCKKK